MNSNVIFGYQGRFFEDFTVGERIVHVQGRTVTYQDNLFFTHSLLNVASIHFDGELMRETEFGKPLLVMTMTLAITYGITSEVFKNVYMEMGIRDLVFRAPVFDGDTLHVETEVLEKREHPENKDVGIVVVKHKVYKNEFSQLVCEFIREALIYKRGRSPRW